MITRITRAELQKMRGTRRWRSLAADTVKAQPVCWLRLPFICLGRSSTADHYLPAAAHPELFYEPSNLRGACKPCNDMRRDLPPQLIPELRAVLARRPGKITREQALRHITLQRGAPAPALAIFGPPHRQ